MVFASRRWLPAFCAILLFLAACAEVPSRIGASPAPAGKIVLSEGRATPAGSRAHPNRQVQLLPIPVVIAVYELCPFGKRELSPAAATLPTGDGA